MADIKNYTLNFGPQHPAAHGVLRLVLELDGEVIQRADPHIGLLHRATEKLAETRTYLQSVPYMDRLDYVSMMANEHAYVMAIEKLIGVDVPVRAQYIRVMFDEITRLLNHLLWLGAHGLDVGAMAVFLYCFREREDLMDVYEAVSGARMHAAYYRPGGVYRDLPDSMPQYRASKYRSENSTRDSTRTARARCSISSRTSPDASRSTSMSTRPCSPTIGSGSSGSSVSASSRRSGRCRWDSPARCCVARASNGTCAASSLTRSMTFSTSTIPIGTNGDSYDRYLVRIEEMRQSNRIIQQCVDWLRANPGPVMTDNHKVAPPSRVEMKSNMEELIHHFKLFTEGFHVPPGEAYSAVEHPKGEFGIYLVSDGANKPYRLKIRAPGFPHLQALDEMARGHMIADAVAIIGTQDIVFGEIDR